MAKAKCLRKHELECLEEVLEEFHDIAFNILKEEVKKVCDRFGYTFISGHHTCFKNAKGVEVINATTDKVIYLVVEWYRDTFGKDAPNFSYEKGEFR
jgi:hypothetical protein